jgi:hypothetical protein
MVFQHEQGTTELTIGALSEQTGVNVETIRYYEREGLLPSARVRRAATGSLTKPTSGECSSFAAVGSSASWEPRSGRFWAGGRRLHLR